MNLNAEDVCFVCGKENEEGLQLDFNIDKHGQAIETEWLPPDRFQGWAGTLHGGVVATLLDEAVGKLAFGLGMPVVTAELVVRYVNPVPTGRPLKVSGRITRATRRLLFAESEVTLHDGSAGARAVAKLMRVKP
jgi:uncharacterized protein (TIGR00369 family)